MGLRPLACWDCGFESPHPGSMDVCCDGCVLSARVLCVGLITRPESRAECDVSECYIETSTMRGLSPTRGCSAMEKNNINLGHVKCLNYGNEVGRTDPELPRILSTSRIVPSLWIVSNCSSWTLSSTQHWCSVRWMLCLWKRDRAAESKGLQN